MSKGLRYTEKAYPYSAMFFPLRASRARTETSPIFATLLAARI